MNVVYGGISVTDFLSRKFRDERYCFYVEMAKYKRRFLVFNLLLFIIPVG